METSIIEIIFNPVPHLQKPIERSIFAKILFISSMLSRHFLRTKVLQSLYAFTIADNNDLPKSEKSMLKSIDELYDLYIYQLSTLEEVFCTAEQNIEEGKQKFFPTEEERNPILRFVENFPRKQIFENRDFIKNRERLKINWANEKDIFRNIFSSFKTIPAYNAYMSAFEVSYVEEKKLVADLYKDLMNYEPLQAAFAEKNLFWEDDFFQMAQLGYKMLKNLQKDFDENSALPTLFDLKENAEEESDRQFVTDLFRKTILHSEETEEIIKKRLQNWDFDRIVLVDLLLLKMAITEFIYFPTIPVKVTINEYIELAKEFSTDKSKLFINGVLDRALIDLRANGKLKKIGRGLLEESIDDQEDALITE